MELGAQVKATRKITGTNPETGRNKLARGVGRVAATGLDIGFHGAVTIVRWANGVESHHCADDADFGIVPA